MKRNRLSLPRFIIRLVSFISLVGVASLSNAQPVADFAADITYGCAPAIVQFTDLSTGSPNSWFWDFGNGNTSTNQNPGAFYVTPGVYTIKLIVSDGNSSDTIIKPYYIKVWAHALSRFSALDTAGCVPLTVNFSDQSIPQSSAVTGWYWNFGDGGYSTSQNPVYTYNAPGSYTVNLIVKDANGCQDSYSRNNYINVYSPTADFLDTINGCPLPANVSFTSISTGNGLTYFWDFGDGTNATVVNPSHNYATEDTFTVVLTVTDINGCIDTAVKKIIIHSYQADFAYNVHCSDDQSITADFTDLSSPAASAWWWDFGDGQTSTIKNPVHIYDTLSTYTIILASSIGSNCIDTVVKTYVPPKASFTCDSVSCQLPFTVNFINLSTGSDSLSYQWFFDDGGSTSTATNPVHTFNIGDEVEFRYYHVTLVVTNEFGCSDTFMLRVTAYHPYADFKTDFVGGCVPFNVEFTDASIAWDSIISWQWNFGDGNTSILENPTHVYPDTGKYTISLIVTTVNGCTDTLVRPDYIQAGIKPDFIDFTLAPQLTCYDPIFDPDTICFHNLYQLIDLSGFNDTTIQVNYWHWNIMYFPSLNQVVSDSFFIQDPIFDSGHMDFGPDTMRLIAGFNGCLDTTYKVVWNRYPISMVCHLNKDSVLGYITDLGACSPPVTLGLFQCSAGYDTVINLDIYDQQTGLTTHLDPYDTTFVTFNKAGRYQFIIETRNDTTKNGGCGDCNPHFMLTMDSVHYGFVTEANPFCEGEAFSFRDTTVSFYGELREWRWDFGDGDVLYNREMKYSVYYDTLKYNPQPDDSIFPVRTEGTDTIIEPLFDHDGAHNGRTYGTYRNPVHVYQNPGTYVVTSQIKVDVLYWCCGSARFDTLRCYYTSYDTVHVYGTSGIKADFSASDSTICPHDTVNFSDLTQSNFPVSGWLWNFGDTATWDTLQSPTHVYDHPGDYNVSLIAENQLGCKDTIIKQVFIHVWPRADFTVIPAENCVGIQSQFTSNAAGNIVAWQWDFGDGITSNLQDPAHVFDTAGTYTVSLTVTDVSGCTDVYIMNNYVIHNKPIAGFSCTPTWANCPPLLVLFSDSSSADVDQWLWNFGDGFTSNQQNSGHLYTYSHQFNISLIVTNSFGCSDTIFQPDMITVGGPSGTLSFDPDSACAPATVTFLTDDSATYQFFWDFGDGTLEFLNIFENGDSTSHNYNFPGVYHPQLILEDSLGCSFAVPVEGPVNIDWIKANFNLGDAVRCDTASVLFGNTTTLFFPATYQWSFGDGDSSQQVSPTHVFNNSGTYTIALEANSSLGCSSDTIKTLIIWKAPSLVITPSDTAGCIPFNVNFLVINTDSTVGIDSWNWDFDDGNASAAALSPHTFDEVGTYNVNLTVMYGDSACITDTVIQVLAYQWPLADFSFSPSSPSLNNATITFDNLSQNANDWIWDFGTGDSSFIKEPVYTYTTDGSYVITLIVSNDALCSDTAVKSIYVSPNDFIAAPQAFSPNGDGANDEFFLFYNGSFDWVEFRVFNRWGELVFETNNFSEGWDGTYKGELQEEGNYSFYVLAKPKYNENNILVKGIVTLIR